MKNEKDLQEMQILEQNMQSLLMQRQTFQLELSETQSALKELENSSEEVYKIVGNLMIKSDKSKIKNDLLDKEKIINLRVKTLEKQEGFLMDKLEKLREKIINSEKK